MVRVGFRLFFEILFLWNRSVQLNLLVYTDMATNNRVLSGGTFSADSRFKSYAVYLLTHTCEFSKTD